ncbi:hypothetical protein RJT34_04864 [Clitoria ternatea]|uniref:Uncharacterized protein n=1 Tax=Clitoria ternatea TaxID=43366 RepID=A0AAN9KM27_CLITE
MEVVKDVESELKGGYDGSWQQWFAFIAMVKRGNVRNENGGGSTLLLNPEIALFSADPEDMGKNLPTFSLLHYKTPAFAIQ